jgi:glycosyltransferase involved in cell wall biosynthesis
LGVVLISIITPTHNPRWLPELYECLASQTYKEWEWVVVLNGDFELPDMETDTRIRFLTHMPAGIGELKKFACDNCNGEYILELDHDDLLFPTALEKVVEAFETSGADFVYSDDAVVGMDDWQPHKWSEYFGWQYRWVEYKNKRFEAPFQPEAYPQNIARIWFAPDHLRAWRKDTYDRIGGHDISLPIADDHDLILRFYLEGNIYHIPEVLYIYRVHGDNTWLEKNADIQDGMWCNFNKYIERLALKWSKDNGLLAIDICSGDNSPEGFISIDKKDGTDLDNDFPFADNSVGVIRAVDALEHLKDPIHTMRECYRVLKHGGFLLTTTPSTDGRGAFQDPTHVSFWNENSFWYYTKKQFNDFIDCPVRFQVLRLGTLERQDNLPYVFADLIAIKDGQRFHGALEI